MRDGTCPKCKGTRIGFFEHVLDAYSNNSAELRVTNREFRKLSAINESTGFFSSTLHEAVVEALVCTECGYFEEYIKNPGEVEWERLPLFRWYKP